MTLLTPVARFVETIERSTTAKLPFRALRAMRLQALDNVRFCDPRAVLVENLTVDGRSVLVKHEQLWRFSPCVPGSMRVELAPASLVVLTLRNVSPRSVTLDLRFLCESTDGAPLALAASLSGAPL